MLTECLYGEGSECLATNLPLLLGKNKVALIRGHGVFAVGDTLKEACSRITMMENQCRLLIFKKLLQK